MSNILYHIYCISENRGRIILTKDNLTIRIDSVPLTKKDWFGGELFTQAYKIFDWLRKDGAIVEHFDNPKSFLSFFEEKLDY